MTSEPKNHLSTFSLYRFTGDLLRPAASWMAAVVLLAGISTAAAGDDRGGVDRTELQLPPAFAQEHSAEWVEELTEYLTSYLAERRIPIRTAELVLQHLPPERLPAEAEAAFDRVAPVIRDTELALRRGAAPREAALRARARNELPETTPPGHIAPSIREGNRATERARTHVERSRSRGAHDADRGHDWYGPPF